MTQEDLKQMLVKQGYEETILFENPDYSTAFIGISQDDRAIYDYEEMVKHLIKTDNMKYDDAVEFIEYNTIRSLPYIENSPIVCKPLVF